MTSQSVTQLLEDLGVTKSHSRPYTSDDNPFSESQFKTMKYRPDYPERFDGFGHAHDWASTFFVWYNHHHRHCGIGLMTPATLHFGQAEQLSAQRQEVLQVAYQAHPERFVNGVPTPPAVPDAVWINPPAHPAPACPAVRETVPGAQSVSRVSGSESGRPLTQMSTGPQSAPAGRAGQYTTVRV